MTGLLIANLAVLEITGDERATGGELVSENIHVSEFDIRSSSGRVFKVAVNNFTGRGTTIERGDNVEDPQVKAFSTEIHFIE